MSGTSDVRNRFRHDASDRLIGLINPQTKRTSFAYNAIDRRVRQRHGNASLTTQLYDDANRLTGLINAKSTGTLVNRFTYSYDNAGNRTVVKESSGDRTSFSYDRAYQLTRERKSGAVTYDVTYSYDPVGNRLVQIDGATRTTCAYDAANQVLTEQVGANRTTYTHDNCGNRARKDAPAALTVYRWDEDNKPTSIHPVSNPVTLTYNALGRRIKKVNPTTTRKFIYDFEKVLQETDNADATTEAYTSTNEQYGELVSAYDGSQTSYFQDDALGSTDALLDDAETVTDRYRYRAFGLDSHYQGATTNPYTFVGLQGYYRDSEIDLYFVGARYYDFALGRWISRDPMGFDAGDSNLYRYVSNTPNSLVDPSGFQKNKTNPFTYAVGAEPTFKAKPGPAGYNWGLNILYPDKAAGTFVQAVRLRTVVIRAVDMDGKCKLQEDFPYIDKGKPTFTKYIQDLKPVAGKPIYNDTCQGPDIKVLWGKDAVIVFQYADRIHGFTRKNFAQGSQEVTQGVYANLLTLMGTKADGVAKDNILVPLKGEFEYAYLFVNSDNAAKVGAKGNAIVGEVSDAFLRGKLQNMLDAIKKQNNKFVLGEDKMHFLYDFKHDVLGLVSKGW